MAGSWWLKLERAEKHFEDFKVELHDYLESQPYEPIKAGPRVARCEHHADCWRYCLRITRQPEPALSIIAGDVLHNARSVLDHLVVAMSSSARRSKARFPVEPDDIWARVGRRYLIRDSERRRRFNSAIAGISPKAAATVKALQPLWKGAKAKRNTIYLLNRLDNADKHRQLVVLAAGLNEVSAEVFARNQKLERPMPDLPDGSPHFVPDGAVVAHFGWAGKPGEAPLSDAEVKVEVRGSPHVAIKIVEPDGDDRRVVPGFMPLDDLLTAILWDLRYNIVPTLEPFVRRRS